MEPYVDKIETGKFYSTGQPVNLNVMRPKKDSGFFMGAYGGQDWEDAVELFCEALMDSMVEGNAPHMPNVIFCYSQSADKEVRKKLSTKMLNRYDFNVNIMDAKEMSELVLDYSVKKDRNKMEEGEKEAMAFFMKSALKIKNGASDGFDI